MPQTTDVLNKEKRLLIRATESEKALLAQAARLRRTNVSQFVLQASLEAASAVVVDQTEYRLSADQWEAFCHRLEEPPKVIPALQELFQEPEVFNAR